MTKMFTGVDIGAHQLKIVTLRQRKDRWGAVAAYAERLEYDRTAPDFPEYAARALQRAVKKHSLPIGEIIMGAPGRGGMLRYLSMPIMPPWRMELAMKYETDEQLSNLKQSPENVATDYTLLQIPEFDPDLFPVLLALSQKDGINERLEICRNALKKTPLDIDLNALGAFNLFRMSPQCLNGEVSVLLDIGAEETHMTIQDGNQLLFARTIPGGGARHTAAIAAALQLDTARAESVKLTHAAVIPPEEEADPTAQRLSQCLHRDITNIAQGVQSAIIYCCREFKIKINPEKLYYTGGGSLLPGFLTELGRRLRMQPEPFVVGNSFAFFGKTEAEETLTGADSGIFSVAAGLAMSRAMPSAVGMSLLPPSVKEKRKFWNEKVFIYYAAAVAVLIIAVIIFHSWKVSSAAHNRNLQWEKQLNTAKRDHEEFAKLEAKTLRAETMLHDLTVRAYSGNRLVDCLRQLRDNTPDEIFYVEMTFDTAMDNLEKKDGESDDGKKGTAQTQPELILSGYLTKQNDYQSACKRLEGHINKLRGISLFSGVVPLVMVQVQDKSPELRQKNLQAKAAAEKEKDGEKNTGRPDFSDTERYRHMYTPQYTANTTTRPPLFTAPPGSALFFTVKCTLKF